MSDFEFITIILSIVVGLTITRVLGGLASVVEHRGGIRVNWLSIGWSIQVLLWSVAFWLGTVNSTRRLDSWTLGSFGVLLSLAIALYFLAAVILPTRIDAATDLVAHFEGVRRPFFSILAAWVAVTTASAFIWGVENFIRLGPPFWIGQTGGIVLALVGVASPRRGVQATLLVVSLVGTVGFIVLRLWSI